MECEILTMYGKVTCTGMDNGTSHLQNTDFNTPGPFENGGWIACLLASCSCLILSIRSPQSAMSG